MLKWERCRKRLTLEASSSVSLSPWFKEKGKTTGASNQTRERAKKELMTQHEMFTAWVGFFSKFGLLTPVFVISIWNFHLDIFTFDPLVITEVFWEVNLMSMRWCESWNRAPHPFCSSWRLLNNNDSICYFQLLLENAHEAPLSSWRLKAGVRACPNLESWRKNKCASVLYLTRWMAAFEINSRDGFTKNTFRYVRKPACFFKWKQVKM